MIGKRETVKFRCVIFDLDGTLANTLGDIALSMNAALAFYGFPALSEEAYAFIVGRGIRSLAESALPENARDGKTAELVAEKALERYAENPVVHSKPYPEITELLYSLKNLKMKTAVLSNKPARITKLVVERLFSPDCFDIVQGEIPGVARKPDPSAAWDIMVSLGVTPRETIFLGDSETDMKTAKAAECSPLGAGWGFRGRAALVEAGAARIIDRPLEMLELIRDTRY
jgi:phosphoglycolate phosphatase